MFPEKNLSMASILFLASRNTQETGMAKSKKTSGKAKKTGNNGEVIESMSMIPGEGVTPEKASSEPGKQEQEVKQGQEPQNEKPVIRITYH